MSADKRAIFKEWLASGKAQLQPLTFPQRELWEASPVPVADSANHICCFIRIQGVITPQAGEAALQRVVERQEVLRLSFLPGKERAVQMIRQTGKANFRFRELAEVERTDEGVEEAAGAVFREPFDLVMGPLYRVEMMRRGTNDHILAFAIHHSIADGWSLGVFVQDLCFAYVQGAMGLPEDTLPPVPQTYSQWGASERAVWSAPVLERCAAFWKSNLAGVGRLWPSLDGPESASGAPHRWVLHFSKELADGAQELARATGATLYSTLLAAFQIALSKWTGKQDILVGTPVANRTTQAVRETMGYCAGIVPLRTQVDPVQIFSAGLKAVHDASVDAFANAMPFAELTAALGEVTSPGRNPIFQVRFALQNHPVPDVSLHGLSAQLRMRSTGTARFQIACEVTVIEQGMEVAWLFRPKLFAQTEIENLAWLFQSVLASACGSPESRISALIP
jgi:hypothetical protein